MRRAVKRELWEWTQRPGFGQRAATCWDGLTRIWAKEHYSNNEEIWVKLGPSYIPKLGMWLLAPTLWLSAEDMDIFHKSVNARQDWMIHWNRANRCDISFSFHLCCKGPTREEHRVAFSKAAMWGTGAALEAAGHLAVVSREERTSWVTELSHTCRLGASGDLYGSKEEMKYGLYLRGLTWLFCLWISMSENAAVNVSETLKLLFKLLNLKTSKNFIFKY